MKSDSSARIVVAFDEGHEESEAYPDIRAPAILHNPNPGRSRRYRTLYM